MAPYAPGTVQLYWVLDLLELMVRLGLACEAISLYWTCTTPVPNIWRTCVQVSTVCRQIHPNLIHTHTHTQALDIMGYSTRSCLLDTSRALANCTQAELSSLSVQASSTHPHPSFHSKRFPSSRQLALLCRRLTNSTSRHTHLRMTLTCGHT